MPQIPSTYNITYNMKWDLSNPIWQLNAPNPELLPWVLLCVQELRSILAQMAELAADAIVTALRKRRAMQSIHDVNIRSFTKTQTWGTDMLYKMPPYIPHESNGRIHVITTSTKLSLQFSV